MATRQQQLDSLGVGVDAFGGLITLEIDGPAPIVALTPAEFKRFWIHAGRAYRDALGDRDCLTRARELRAVGGDR